MGYNHDIALYLLGHTEDEEVIERARDKIKSVTQGNEKLANLVNCGVEEIQLACEDSGIRDLLLPYFIDVSNSTKLDSMKELPFQVSKQDTVETIKTKKSKARLCGESFIFAIDSYCVGLSLVDALELLCVLEQLKAPHVLVGPIANDVFARLNELDEDSRRRAIDMTDDVYTENNTLVKEIVIARTEWAVDKASGALWQEDAEDETDNFAWPTDEAPALNLTAPQNETTIKS